MMEQQKNLLFYLFEIYERELHNFLERDERAARRSEPETWGLRALFKLKQMDERTKIRISWAPDVTKNKIKMRLND